MSDEPLMMTLADSLPDDARMNAYYYSFDRTGIGVIDAILSAVAIAGKGAHRTEDWNDEEPEYYSGRPGLPLANSAAELIQRTAEQSAQTIKDALIAERDDRAELVKALRKIAKDAPAEPPDTYAEDKPYEAWVSGYNQAHYDYGRLARDVLAAVGMEEG